MTVGGPGSLYGVFMWRIPSMVDGQGCVLGFGSISDTPLYLVSDSLSRHSSCEDIPER